jgi:hypothetical protein
MGSPFWAGNRSGLRKQRVRNAAACVLAYISQYAAAIMPVAKANMLEYSTASIVIFSMRP